MAAKRVSSIFIQAPVASAFECMKDPSSFNELMPGVQFTGVVMAADGVGTTYRFETRVAGFPIRGGGRFSAVEANRHIRDETTIAMEGSFDYWFEAERDGVRVTIDHHPGRFWDLPIIGRLIADSYERDDRAVLQRLKTKLDPSAP